MELDDMDILLVSEVIEFNIRLIVLFGREMPVKNTKHPRKEQEIERVSRNDIMYRSTRIIGIGTIWANIFSYKILLSDNIVGVWIEIKIPFDAKPKAKLQAGRHSGNTYRKTKLIFFTRTEYTTLSYWVVDERRYLFASLGRRQARIAKETAMIISLLIHHRSVIIHRMYAIGHRIHLKMKGARSWITLTLFLSLT